MLFHSLLIEVTLLTDVAHSLFGRELLALFLGVSESDAKFDTLNTNSSAEGGAIGTHGVLVQQFEVDFALCFLPPLDELALEVVILFGYLVEVYMCSYDTLLEEAVAVAISAVEVDRTDEGFKSVSRDETVVCMVDVCRLYELYKSYLLGYTVEAAALYYLATYGGEEALFLAREMVIEDVAYDGLNDGVAQVFETFIVFLLLVMTVVIDRAVYQRFVVYRYLMGIESEDAM